MPYSNQYLSYFMPVPDNLDIEKEITLIKNSYPGEARGRNIVVFHH